MKLNIYHWIEKNISFQYTNLSAMIVNAVWPNAPHRLETPYLSLKEPPPLENVLPTSLTQLHDKDWYVRTKSRRCGSASIVIGAYRYKAVNNVLKTNMGQANEMGTSGENFFSFGHDIFHVSFHCSIY